ncbi:MAG: hypothetical protein LR015_06355 [Verrucomicrobia bacterium]|nr:hypothetical protein [Verrucomicrobiota bacterium]
MMKTIAYLQNLIELNAAFSGKLWLVAFAIGMLMLIAVLEWRRPATMQRLVRPDENKTRGPVSAKRQKEADDTCAVERTVSSAA